MHTIHVEKELNAPADKLWALIADFSNLRWYPAAEKVEKIGTGIGEIRRITLPGMPSAVEERLLDIDAADYRIVYEVLENDINIMRDYTVVATLVSTGPQSTRASWRGSFSGVSGGVEAGTMIELMTDTYGTMLKALEQAANRS